MKKLLTLLLASILIFSLTACGSDSDSTAEEGNATDETKEIERYEKEEMTLEKLDKLLAEEPLCVTSSSYVAGDPELTALYPSMLSCILQNNSDQDIKDAVIAFVAWDANNLPVVIKSQYDFTDGSYVSQVDYDAINLVPGGTFGQDYGLSLDEESNTITTCKAIPVSYTTFDGETWNNPYYDDFKKLYEGQKLK